MIARARGRLAEESPHHVERGCPHCENTEKGPLEQSASDYSTGRCGQTGSDRRDALRRDQSGSGDCNEQGQREDVEEPPNQPSRNRTRAEQECQSGAKRDDSDHDHQGQITHP